MGMMERYYIMNCTRTPIKLPSGHVLAVGETPISHSVVALTDNWFFAQSLLNSGRIYLGFHAESEDAAECDQDEDDGEDGV